MFKEVNRYLEIRRRQYDLLEEAIEAMGAPFQSAENFMTRHIDAFLEKYEEYKEATSNNNPAMADLLGASKWLLFLFRASLITTSS